MIILFLTSADRVGIVPVSGYHPHAEEIPNLDDFDYVEIYEVPVAPNGYALAGYDFGTGQVVFTPTDETEEDRLSNLESENAALKATLDDMILNSPFPAMQAAIDELILTGGGL